MGQETVGLRAVLDTNTVVSAPLFSRGRVAWLRAAWQQGLLIPVVSRGTVEELLRVLAYPKFNLSAQEKHELLADYLPFAETVAIPSDPPAVPRCRDPHHEKFLELAVAAGADVLVSGDSDILALSPDFPVPIVSPAQLRARIRHGHGGAR